MAISTVALALITYNISNKQYKKALIEKQLEEFYIPLIERLTYPTDSLNNRLDGNSNKRMLQISGLKESINRIIRKKVIYPIYHFMIRHRSLITYSMDLSVALLVVKFSLINGILTKMRTESSGRNFLSNCIKIMKN
ncbi:MAG: hypothetical protein QXL94_02775 [Candidatus Parvarchaeum sp.]